MAMRVSGVPLKGGELPVGRLCAAERLESQDVTSLQGESLALCIVSGPSRLCYNSPIPQLFQIHA